MTYSTVICIKAAVGEWGFSLYKSDVAPSAARVVSIVPGGAAARAGLRVDQRIVSVGTHLITGLTTKELQDLMDKTLSRFGELTLHIVEMDDANSNNSNNNNNGLTITSTTATLPSPPTSTTTTTTTTHYHHQSPSPMYHQLIPDYDYRRHEEEKQRPQRTGYTTSGGDCLEEREAVEMDTHSWNPLDTAETSSPLVVVRKQAYHLQTVNQSSLDTPDSTPCIIDPHRHTDMTPLPQIYYKPRHVQNATLSHRIATVDLSARSTAIGAVARLAIDGGLTQNQLLHIGSTSHLGTTPITATTTFSEDSIKPHATSRITIQQRLARPISQPVNPCTSSHQSIHLSRPFGDASGGTRFTHRRGHTAPWLVGSRSPTAAMYYNRRGSFPLHMTRVGGLVLQPVTTSGEFPAHHSMSASTSPTVAMTTTTTTTTSSSADTRFQFPENLQPYETGMSTPVTTTTDTPLSSQTNSTESHHQIPSVHHSKEIVRLGPGRAISHAISGECGQYTVNSLIRMHDCPQPYVRISGRGGVEGDRLTDPHLASATPDLDLDYATAETMQSGTEKQQPVIHRSPNREDISLANLRHSSPDSAMWNAFVARAPLAQNTHRPKGGFASPPAQQVARTVRHLRRIRHIFGDSQLGYGSSATSASMGTLAVSDKGTPGSSNSLIELRDHETRSVESERPASYTCKCLLEFPTPSDRDCSTSESVAASSEPFGLVRFALTATEEFTPWYRYRLRLLDDKNTLVMTRITEGIPTEHPNSAEHLSHLHATLCEENIQWHKLNEFPDLLSSCPFTSLTADPTMHGVVSPVLATVRIPPQHVTCQLVMDRHLAVKTLAIWGPPASMLPHNVDLPCTKAQQQQESYASPPAQPTIRNRSSRSTGRSASLGVAGPPGAGPLFRAMGTAAASIGIPVMLGGRSSWLLGSQGSSSSRRVEISNPIPLADNPFEATPSGFTRPEGESIAFPAPDSSTPSIATDPIKRPTDKRLSRGRLHHALARISRATAASISDPTSRNSPSGTSTSSGRRIASTHGVLQQSKSVNRQTGCGTNVCLHDGVPLDLANYPGPVKVDRIGVMESNTITTTIMGNSSSGSSAITAPMETKTISVPALLLASSVSPTPALQSPYMTYLTVDGKSVETVLNSPSSLGNTPLTCSNDELLKVGGPPLSSSDSGRLSVAELQLTDTSQSASTGGTSPPLLVTVPSGSFIPLPLPLTGSMALHKCPRSSLSPFVPFVVELCVTLVERYGLNCVGLYRLSGSKLAHDFISTELRKPLGEINVNSDKWNDIHAVCGVLKTFLRNLRDSLFPKVMYPDFLAACRHSQREKRLLSIQRLLGIMECYPHHPEYRAHRATLRYLATHLARVSSRKTVNKMTTYNLALVFAPNLVQPCEDTPELLMSDSKYKIMLVETVIKYHSWIFSADLGLESGCSVPADSEEDLTTIGSPSVELTDVAASSNLDLEDPMNQPGRVEGDVQPIVAELLNKAADLPPPPSDTDLETVEEPGPASDRPSDIALPSQPTSLLPVRPRFTSIPSNVYPLWSTGELPVTAIDPSINALDSATPAVAAAGVNRLTSGGGGASHHMQPELTMTLEAAEESSVTMESSMVDNIPRPRPFSTQLDTKLDNLRHLSQGCLDQYTSASRQLDVRVTEARRQMQDTMSKRLHAEQLLQQARNQSTPPIVSLGDVQTSIDPSTHSNFTLPVTDNVCTIEGSDSSSDDHVRVMIATHLAVPADISPSRSIPSEHSTPERGGSIRVV